MEFRKREPDDPRPNITPLVDILFLLIIFFTVTTTFATAGGIDINLPQAASQRRLEKVEKLFVVINSQGRVFIEGERLSYKALSKRFAELAGRNKDALVIIEADRQTDHGEVVAVMDSAQSAGLTRLAIATRSKPTQPEEEEESEN